MNRTELPVDLILQMIRSVNLLAMKTIQNETKRKKCQQNHQ